MGKHGFEADDAICGLDAAGLVHRLVVSRSSDLHAEREEIVIPSRAARRHDD
jgi:hypothetical protein